MCRLSFDRSDIGRHPWPFVPFYFSTQGPLSPAHAALLGILFPAYTSMSQPKGQPAQQPGFPEFLGLGYASLPHTLVTPALFLESSCYS